MPQILLRFATALIALTLAATAGADTLSRIRDSGTIRVGVRTDAAPFSFTNELGESAGYSVLLCREVAVTVRKALGLEQLPITYVKVSAEDRFKAVAEGRVDLHCGAATMTLPRRQVVDFSLPTFVDGASVLFRADGPASFNELAGKKVGVRAGTTTEEALRNTLEGTGIDAEVTPVKDHADGLAKLESGDISAYFADRSILGSLASKSAGREQLRLSKRFFTYEAHGLAMMRNDADFRLLVDTTLARMYRSGRIEEIFRASFGEKATPGDLLLAMYVISSLSE